MKSKRSTAPEESRLRAKTEIRRVRLLTTTAILITTGFTRLSSPMRNRQTKQTKRLSQDPISATTTQTDGSAYSIMTIRRICTTAAVCAALSRFRESLCQSNPSRRNPRRKQAIDSIWRCAVWDSHLTDWPSKAWSVFFLLSVLLNAELK